MSYTETRDAAMNATLAAIDDVAEVKCGHCNEPLATDGPSGYWCDDWCQAKWMDGQADNPRDVYDRTDAAGGWYSDSMHSHGNLPGMTVEEAAEAMGVSFAALGRSVTDWEESAIQVRDAVNASPYEVSAYARAMQRIEDDPNGVPEYAAIAQRVVTGMEADESVFEAYRRVVVQSPRRSGVASAFRELSTWVNENDGFIRQLANWEQAVNRVRALLPPHEAGEVERVANEHEWTLQRLEDVASRLMEGEPWGRVTARERALQARQNRNTGPTVRRRNPRRIDPRGTR